MQILKNHLKRKEIIDKIIRVVRQEGVLMLPSDTVYGLMGDATSKRTVDKIFKIKKRSYGKPLPVFIKDVKTAKKFAYINKKQENFLRKVWPGNVTVILKAKNKKFPKGILSKQGKIGLRIPKNKLLNLLLKELDFPLAETSANISGETASTKIDKVLRYFKEEKHQPDLILNAGDIKEALPSTVIDLTNSKVLREGEFSKDKILKILKEV